MKLCKFQFIVHHMCNKHYHHVCWSHYECIECFSHSISIAFPVQLLHGWQSEQSGGLPKNSSVGHTDRSDH